MRQELTVKLLCEEARVFAEAESGYAEPMIYGVTDGKAVGTYFNAQCLAGPRHKKSCKQMLAAFY